jgi:sugar lactone lactonase YvrE
MTAKNLLLAGQSIDAFGLRNARFEGELPEIYTTAETGTLRQFYFKPDGTKLYLVGEGEDSIFQYSLSTAWDIRTATYDSKSYAVTTEETNPRGIWLKDDGTKMYVVGIASDTVYQYTLATAWDVSSATYDTVSLSVSSQDPSPEKIVFNPDGTSFYIVGGANKTFFQYDLTSAWDLSTASYASKSKNVSTEISTTALYGLTFSSDGTKMYAGSHNPQIIYQYSLSTAWDVSTASYDSKEFATGINFGFGLFMRDTDAQIIAGNAGNYLISFNLATAQDITTVVDPNTKVKYSVCDCVHECERAPSFIPGHLTKTPSAPLSHLHLHCRTYLGVHGRLAGGSVGKSPVYLPSICTLCLP